MGRDHESAIKSLKSLSLNSLMASSDTELNELLIISDHIDFSKIKNRVDIDGSAAKCRIIFNEARRRGLTK